MGTIYNKVVRGLPEALPAGGILYLGPYECVGANSPRPQGNLQCSRTFSMMPVSEI